MAFSKFSHVKITAIAGVVPENFINIDDEIQYYDNDPKKLERIKKILGLGIRHVVEEGVTTCDLCEVAANRLISEAEIERKNIDLILVASTSHDYNYPPTACILQGLLNLDNTCTAIDTHGYGCTGYVHALLVASSMIESGAIKNALVLVGDISSKDSDIRNRLTNILFGDAVVATYVEYTDKLTESWFYTGCCGKEYKNIISPAGGFKLKIKEDLINLEVRDKANNVWHLWENYINGMNVFKFSMEVAPKTLKELLQYAEKSINDIDFVGIHQANKQIIQNIAKIAELPMEKYSSETFTKYANCATAAVAVNVCDALWGKNVKNILLCTFGVGLSWGNAIINFENVKNLGIEQYPFTPKEKREDLIEYWKKAFKNE